jgi:hypothetical protein
MSLDDSPLLSADDPVSSPELPSSGDRHRRGRRRMARPAERDAADGFGNTIQSRGRDGDRDRRPPARRRGGRVMQSGPPAVRCVRAIVSVPIEWPVRSRQGVATAKMIEVDRRDDERLVCDCLHDGPHFWPDVEPAPPIWDAELDASLSDPEAEGDDALAGPATNGEVTIAPVAAGEPREDA